MLREKVMDSDQRRQELQREREALEVAALHRLRNKCFIGGSLLGFVAGALGPWMEAARVKTLVFEGLMGLILLLVTAFLGGFLGVVARNMVRWLKGYGVETGDTTIDGVVLGAFGGAFIGLVVKLIMWDMPGAAMGAATGSFIGSFIGALPGEAVTVVARMVALDDMGYTPPKRDDS